MTPTFSILHATYGRPQKAVEAMRRWFARAAMPECAEHIFACNEDDMENHLQIIAGAHDYYEAKAGRILKIVSGPFPGSAPAWNAAAKASTGRWLVQASDDVDPPQNWDQKLAWEMPPLSLGEFESPDVIARPTVIAVSDGYRKDALLTTAICNRARYEQVGHFICPEYRSVYSDDDFTIRAIADNADGKCTLINARDLVFKHAHHYHDKSVAWDATYARSNAPEAYAQGESLFMQRNADLIARRLKTW